MINSSANRFTAVQNKCIQLADSILTIRTATNKAAGDYYDYSGGFTNPIRAGQASFLTLISYIIHNNVIKNILINQN